MLTSAPAAWLLVALCAVAGAYCVLRTRSALEEQRRSAGADATMGFGMAAMAVPAAAARPPGSWQVCAAVFGAMALHAAWSARPGRHGWHGRHHLHHLVGASAMVYMAAVMAGGDGHGHMGHMAQGGMGIPALTGLLLVYFTAHVLWAGARLAPSGPPAPGARDGKGGLGWADRPELARACQLAMSIGMLAMLLAM